MGRCMTALFLCWFRFWLIVLLQMEPGPALKSTSEMKNSAELNNEN